MDIERNLRNFGLYGESPGRIAPEFVHVEAISTRASLHDWSISAHVHPGIDQLLLLTRGAGSVLADGVRTDLAPACLVAVPSHSVHGFRFDPRSEGWVFSFASELLNDRRLAALGRMEALTARGAGIALLSPGSRDLERLQWLFADLAADLAGSVAGAMEGRRFAQFGMILAVAAELLENVTQARPAGRREALVANFRALVDAHYRQGWPVARFARELGTSEPTLTRACRATLGKAPAAVLHDRLLLEAMRYLTYSSATVSQISGHLGFSDPAYFARFFKTKTGATATRFRKERLWLAPTDLKPAQAGGGVIVP